MSANKEQLHKIHKVIMTAARAAIEDYCFKKSKIYILNKCGWLNIHNMIKFAAINIIHNIIINKIPTSIFNLFKINRRSSVDIVTYYRPKTRKTEQFFIYNGLKLYNKLPNDIKIKNNIKRELKIYLKKCEPNDTFD